MSLLQVKHRLETEVFGIANIPRGGFYIHDMYNGAIWVKNRELPALSFKITDTNLMRIMRDAGFLPGAEVPGRCLLVKTAANRAILIQEKMPEFDELSLRGEKLKLKQGHRYRLSGQYAEYPMKVNEEKTYTYVGSFRRLAFIAEQNGEGKWQARHNGLSSKRYLFVSEDGEFLIFRNRGSIVLEEDLGKEEGFDKGEYLEIFNEDQIRTEAQKMKEVETNHFFFIQFHPASAPSVELGKNKAVTRRLKKIIKGVRNGRNRMGNR